MPSRKPLIPPHWVRYEVSDLVQRHIDTWKAFCRESDRLREGPSGQSPSEMHRNNPERPRLETVSKLLDIALKETGPVQYDRRVFRSSESTYREPEPADRSIADARGLFVEIYSPINGMGRKCQ